MNMKLIVVFALLFLILSNISNAQKATYDIPYVENGHERQVLDIYTPERAVDSRLPVMFGYTVEDGRPATRAMSL